MKEKIEAIVREVVADFLKQHQTRNKKLLILLNYESPNQQHVWDHIKAINEKADVILLVSESWSDIPTSLSHLKVIQLHDETSVEIKALANEVDALLLPAISFGYLAKLAMTIDDEKALSLSIQMQLAGKKLILAKDAITPKGEQKLVVPHSIQDRITMYTNQLIKDGVTVLKLKDVQKWLEQNVKDIHVKKPVLLAKHLEEMAEEGDRELQLSKKTVISPLSKDMARELGISLKIKE